MCKYDIYESGYQNGITFGYIPDLDKEQMRIWLVGYKDAKDKKHKSLNEIDNIYTTYLEKEEPGGRTQHTGTDKASLDESTLYEGYFSRIADKLADDKYQEDTAKEIAIDWHGGQWSPLYKIACGNLRKMTADEVKDAIDEVNRNLKDCEPREKKRLELLKVILEDRV